MKEKSADPTEQGSVNSRHHAAQERPFALAVMGDGRVGMVQKRAHHYETNFSLFCGEKSIKCSPILHIENNQVTAQC